MERKPIAGLEVGEEIASLRAPAAEPGVLIAADRARGGLGGGSGV